ncbi:MAG: translation initiation factor IF-1 [Patescibacteria group bacterium]
MPSESKGITVKALVIEALANAHFRLKFEKEVIPEYYTIPETEEGFLAIGYLSGKMRMNRIRVLVGDSVEVLLDEYGGKPRITRRL